MKSNKERTSKKVEQIIDVDYDMCIRMLRFTRHYKDTVRKRLMFLISVAHLLEYMHAKNYHNRAWSDEIIAKIKRCSFLTHSVEL